MHYTLIQMYDVNEVRKERAHQNTQTMGATLSVHEGTGTCTRTILLEHNIQTTNLL